MNTPTVDDLMKVSEAKGAILEQERIVHLLASMVTNDAPFIKRKLILEIIQEITKETMEMKV
jgi:hypothetical protein